MSDSGQDLPSRFLRPTHARGSRHTAAGEFFTATLFGTLVSTFVIKVQILSLLCVVAQFSALTWYMLSYIPYGQQCLKRLISRFL